MFILTGKLSAQVSYGGKPYPYETRKAVHEMVRMPGFDYNQVLKEIKSSEIPDGKKPLPVAWNYEVNFNTSNSGYWQQTDDGVRLWRLEIYSEEAFAIGIFFNEFLLQEGARIFIYNPEQTDIRGSFDHRSNKISGNLPVSFIPGEKVIIELQVSEKLIDFGRLEVGTVSHAFIDLFGISDYKDGRYGLSGNCNVDINCPSGEFWQEVKRSVCRIIFKRSTTSLSELCTGTLINNTNSDGVPYLLTANHCISTAFSAESAVFYFEYESPECDGPDGQVNRTTAGSVIKATSDSLDFSLLLLSEDIPESYNPYFAGWTRTTSPASSSVCIHHPMGDVKKISVENDPVTSQYQPVNPPSWLNESVPNGFWRVTRWDEGATEGGSSGSPLFNNNKMIVGNLTGGDATCANPVNDYFSKFHMCWDYYSPSTKQLKSWLDEKNTGSLAVIGYDPFFIPGPTANIMEIIAHSTDHEYFKEAILLTDLAADLTDKGPYTVFAPVDKAFKDLPPTTFNTLFSTSSDDLLFIVRNHILNAELNTQDLTDGRLLEASSGRMLEITNKNNLFVDYANIIVKDINALNGVVHFIDAVLLLMEDTDDSFLIFPNPAIEEFWLTSDGIMTGSRMKIYSTNGILIADYEIKEEKLARFKVPEFSSGVYIITIEHNNRLIKKKLVIAKSPN